MRGLFFTIVSIAIIQFLPGNNIKAVCFLALTRLFPSVARGGVKFSQNHRAGDLVLRMLNLLICSLTGCFHILTFVRPQAVSDLCACGRYQYHLLWPVWDREILMSTSGKLCL
jgi:hypothetical protein